MGHIIKKQSLCVIRTFLFNGMGIARPEASLPARLWQVPALRLRRIRCATMLEGLASVSPQPVEMINKILS